MKPVVSAFNAWFCTVISCFAIVILSVLGSLFARGHHTVLENDQDDPKPENAAAIASAIFIAVAVYGGFLVFCGLQAWLHTRASRKGAISLR